MGGEGREAEDKGIVKSHQLLREIDVPVVGCRTADAVELVNVLYFQRLIFLLS